MIIKDDKVVEADVERVAENPPPYSLAPEVRVAVVDHDAPSAGQSQTPQNNNHNVIFRPRGSSSASLAPSPTLVPTSGSSAYSDSTSTVKPPDVYTPVPPPPGVPRTSFLHVERQNRPISTRFIIDPYLPLPPHAYAALNVKDMEGDEDDFGPRLGSPVPGDPDIKNVSLKCKNGNVSAEVWVYGREEVVEVDEKRKAGIDVRAKNGFVRLKVHTIPISPSFSLRIASKNGGVHVSLPRSFSGPLTTHTKNGWVTLSPALASCTTAFSEMRGTRKSFIGDFVDSGYGKGDWSGSSLHITCENGRIKLSFLDEDNEKTKSGFFGRPFS